MNHLVVPRGSFGRPAAVPPFSRGGDATRVIGEWGRCYSLPGVKALFLAPWFRTLAVGWAEGLRARGHEVRVVTTTQHFDPPPVHDQDIVFEARWRTRAGVAEATRAFRVLRAWRPDVVITDPVSDPRYLALSLTGRAQAFTTHDAKPHDESHRQPLLRRLNTSALMRRADAELVFSRHVASVLGDRGHRVVVLPLMSEMPESDVPPFVPAAERRDFLVVGRLSQYKNVPTILEAYERHRASGNFRGDRLVVIGGGDPGCELPDHVERIDERFRFADVAPRMAAAKASICLYSAGSQSGVQVWAMQCGTPSIVSEVGALGEYLPEGEGPLCHDDIDALVRQLDRFADAAEAERVGQVSRAAYDARLRPEAVAAALEDALESLVREARP